MYVIINTTDYAGAFTIIPNDLAQITGYDEAHTPFSDIVDAALLYNGEAVKIIRKNQSDLIISCIVQASYPIVESIDGETMTTNRQMMEKILSYIYI